MITTVKGLFKSLRGTIVLDGVDPSCSSVEVEIDTASLDSGSEMRDHHVKSADFLDSKNYPLITFKSTHVEPQGPDHARVIGDLTIKGVTREVVLDTELTGRGKAPGGSVLIGFDARTQIARSDFGITMNMALEAGGVLVSEIVKIEISAQAHQ
jgi:polyisoprenoid-binding protein YceI